MTDQNTWHSILADWTTNTPAYQSGLTDQPTYHFVPANIPDYPCRLTDCPTYLTLLGLTDQPTCLNIYPSWLTDTHTSLYQPIHQGRLTDQYTYLSGITDQPTYLTIRLDWPTNIPALLSGLTDSQTYLTIYPYWNLCIASVLSAAYQCICIITHLHIRTDSLLPSEFLFYLLIIISAYLSGPTDWPASCYLRIFIWADCLSVRLTIMPVYLSCIPAWVNYRHTYMPTYLSWLKHFCLHFLPYISRLTNWPTYLSTSLGWLLPNLPIGADWPTDIPVYLSGLTRIKKHACLPLWLTILPPYTAYVSGLTRQTK